MTKTISDHIVSHAAKTGRAVSQGIQGVHKEIGLPSAPAWAGYWTFVTATILGMFILYTAKQNTLSQWIGFLGWGGVAPVGSAAPAANDGTASTPTNPNVGTVVGAGAVPGFPGLNLNNPFAGIPAIGGGFQSLLPGNSNSATPSTPPATAGQATINPFAQWLSPYLKSLGVNNQ